MNRNTVKCSEQKKSDFSIEHILTKAGNKNNSNCLEYQNMQNDNLAAFSWLNCTRYCPPKLPRSQKKEGPQKRQLGRHPRIPFSSQQLAVLEDKFKQSPYLSSAEVTQLSRNLHLADIRVKIWFQNRRARERREKQEQEVQQLKPYTNDKQNTNIFTAENPATSTSTPTSVQKTYFRHSSYLPDHLYTSLPQETQNNRRFGNFGYLINRNQSLL